MKCRTCGKEINLSADAKRFNERSNGRVTYDMMGYGKENRCLSCIDSATEHLTNDLAIRNII